MSDQFKHCCAHMDRYTVTGEEDFIIYYRSDVRSYAFQLRENGKYIGVNQRLWYCPWCGKKLPKDLLDEIEEVLEKEYGITQKDLNNSELIPEEFNNDEWWKKRGL